MTPTKAKEHRAAIMNLTADLRDHYGQVENELRKVRAEMAEIDYPCVRLTRLSDREWDLSARLKSIAFNIEARVDAYNDKALAA